MWSSEQVIRRLHVEACKNRCHDTDLRVRPSSIGAQYHFRRVFAKAYTLGNLATMLYWECKRRLAILREFRMQAVDYFENIEYAGWMAGGAPLPMNEVAQKAFLVPRVCVPI